MATARDIVTWALRKATVLPSGDDPSADELADGLEALNEMLDEWAIDGMDLELATPLVAADEVDTEDAYIRAIRYNLAEDLCEDYGLPIPANVARRAELGRRIVTAALFTIADLELDTGFPRRWLANDYYG